MRRIRNTLLFCLLIAVLLCFCGCSDRTRKISLSPGTPPILPDNDKSIYTCNKKVSELEKISGSGRISLYYDKESCSVCIYDSDTRMLWKSLPEKFNSKFETLPSILELDIIANGRTYTVNSQNCCVRNGLAVYEKTEGGLTVNYSFLIDADSKSVNITVPVKYVLKDGSLFVSMDCGSIGIETNTDVILREVRLMNFFGSCVDAQKGDFMLVPDGCGAIIYTDNVSSDFQPVTLKVYGSDCADRTEASPAPIGAYGFKQGNSAAVAVIEQGEAIASVKADTSSLCGYNYTGAGFTVTASGESGKKMSFSENSYEGEVRLCFRFLSNGNATYAAMASACREQLIRNGVLSAESRSEKDILPAVVSLIGAASVGNKKTISALTTYEQAQDMLALLKAKGLGNIYLRFCGLFEGGMNQTDIASFRFNKLLGGQKELDELTQYINAQGHRLFYDIDLISYSKGSISSKRTARDITGKALTVSDPGKKSVLRLSELEDTVLKLLGKSREYDFTGFCLADTGNMLYSDYSSDRFSVRQSAMNEVLTQCEPLVTGRELMSSTGNLFMLKNICATVNIPMSTSYEVNFQYRAVPFLQMVIHGSMYYAGTPLNTSANPEKAILRSIEYGAVPSFELCYANAEGYENCYYAPQANSISEMVLKAQEALSGLGNMRITNHYKVQDKVYCTEYSNSTAIYVNYSDKEVTVSDTVLEPMGFLRVG